MRFATLCSGVGAPEVAFSTLGWDSRFCAEIEPFPNAILQHHFPNTPNYGNIERFKQWPDEPLDLLVAGTPCQSFSLAGLRKGLDDPRGNLTLTALAIVAKYQPRWFLWENVYGVLSHDKGRTFGTFLTGLGQLGYGFAYRVLDAQYVRTCGHCGAVPQRRRRVFAVGCLGDWRHAAAVLFDAESLRGNPPPRRISGQSFTHSVASCVGASGRGFDRTGETRGQDPVVACPLTSNPYGDHESRESLLVAHSLRAEGFDASEDGTGRGTPIVPVVGRCDTASQTRLDGDSQDFIPCLPFDTTQMTSKANRSNPKAGDPCHPLAAQAHPPCIAFPERMSSTQHASAENVAPAMGSVNQTAIAFQERGRENGTSVGIQEEVAYALTAPNGGGRRQEMNIVKIGVRRLTPLECERLMGLPDFYTAIKVNGKMVKDGPRYRALGNSICINHLEWLAERIAMVDAIP